MAQSIVHNFRRMSMADLNPESLGTLSTRKGGMSGTGKENMKKKLLLVTCWAVYASWSLTTMWNPSITKSGPIEHFAAQGVIKDAIWTARLGCLGLKARIDVPVAGTMLNVVNDRLQVENPPNGWPITAESGWQEYHNKADQTFEEIVADLANTRFNKTVFEGTVTAQAFEWDIAMETSGQRITIG